MRFETLEINRLSRSGEILRKIRCLAGHVTVFRSNSERDLSQLSDAIAGSAGEDCYTILLDSVSFDPKAHQLIGFATDSAPDQTIKLKHFLVAAGVGEASLEKMLLEFGLGGMKERPFAELSEVQVRTARLIAATFCPAKVLVLRDPFEGMAKHVCEALGKLLADYAWETKTIVVVTRLGVRPDCWLENEIITRVQLERPRNPTIGLSTIDPALIAAAIAVAEEARKEESKLRNEGKLQEAAKPPVQTLVRATGNLPRTLTQVRPLEVKLVSKKFQRGQVIQTPMQGVLAVSSLIALMVVAIIVKDAFFEESPPEVVLQGRPSKPAAHPLVPTVEGGLAKVAGVEPELKAPPAVPSPQDATPTVVVALSDYPSDIRESITRVFDDPEGVMKLQVASTKVAPAPVSTNAVRKPFPGTSGQTRSPLEALRGRSESSDPLNIDTSSTPHEWNNEEMEARREEVRRRFLEAIQRASHEDELDDEEE